MTKNNITEDSIAKQKLRIDGVKRDFEDLERVGKQKFGGKERLLDDFISFDLSVITKDKK